MLFFKLTQFGLLCITCLYEFKQFLIIFSLSWTSSGPASNLMTSSCLLILDSIRTRATMVTRRMRMREPRKVMTSIEAVMGGVEDPGRQEQV